MPLFGAITQNLHIIMTNSYIGIDSTTFFHAGKTTFKAPIGVAVEVKNHERFDKYYFDIMEKLKQKYEIDTPKMCLKAHYVFEKLGSKRKQFLDEFVDAVIPQLTMIYVGHLIIPPKKIPEIISTNGTRTPTMKFRDMLLSSFNHVVAWNILERFPDKTESYIFMDYFTAVTTSAWEDMRENQNIFVLPSGEYCNTLISTADFFCKFIRYYLNIKHEKVGHGGISSVFADREVDEIKQDEKNASDGCKLYQQSRSTLAKIAPISNRTMDVDLRLKHPVYYILSDQRLKKEKSILVSSPLYDKLTNNAIKTHGCVRVINLDDMPNEVKYMRPNDRIITIGKKAQDDAAYLVDGYGLLIDIISSQDIMKSDDIF